jgi:hypothetical protein
MFNTSLVDALLDTTVTATAALRSMAGQPFNAAEFIARWQRLDDIATGRIRPPVRVVAYVRQPIEA